MSAQGAIPPSIRDALESTAGYVLLVAGKPGTGKSYAIIRFEKLSENQPMLAKGFFDYDMIPIV